MIPTTPTPIPVKDGIANPAPLGLCAFGMTTVLLNLHNAGFFELNSMILAMGIFYGGLAQVIAGVIESKKNNIFGLTAFTSYGFFWLTLVGLIVMPKLGWGTAPSDSAMCAYLSIWGVFTLCLFFGTLRLNRALQFVFATLVILFFLLAASHATGNKSIGTFAGYEGLICGFAAIYTGVATLLNDVYGKTVLPVGTVVV
jgi:succinate-acetate transporter protein